MNPEVTRWGLPFVFMYALRLVPHQLLEAAKFLPTSPQGRILRDHPYPEPIGGELTIPNRSDSLLLETH